MGINVVVGVGAAGSMTWRELSHGSTSSSVFPSPYPTPLIPLYAYLEHSGYVEAVAWSPDGKRITSASGDKTVQVWDATDGSHAFVYHGHADAVRSVAWSPDGKRIASASGNSLIDSTGNTVRVWSVG